MHMQLGKSASFVREEAHAVSDTLGRWFPTPLLIAPRTAGIDISDSSIKWLALLPEKGYFRVDMYGEEPLESGVVVNGAVANVDALMRTLKKVRKRLGDITCVHAALPEEGAYVFTMHIPSDTPRDQATRMIEFEFEGRVPLQPSAAVYDYDVIARFDKDEGEEIGVSAFPIELAENYQRAFEGAGLTLLSLELEARSIARAVLEHSKNAPITLLVDFGRARTGFALVKNGIPIFTSTAEIGGDAITRVLVGKLGLSAEDAEAFKNEHGLVAPEGEKSAAYEAMVGTISALSDEIARHFHYWDTRRNDKGERVTPVSRVVLVGGSSNMRGLADYIAGRVQAPTEVGNIWRHVSNFDTYIPPIGKHHSLQYATSIGLALRSLV